MRNFIAPSAPAARPAPPGNKIRRAGFTLVELLVVVGIIVLMMTLVVPAFNAIRGGTDFTSEVFDISGLLEEARAYAMSNNTFVLVGIAETSGTLGASASPQVSGTGRIAIAIIASKDGTRPYQSMITSGNFNTWQTQYGTGGAFTAVAALTTFTNIHMVDLQGGSPAVPVSGNMARPAVPSTSYDIPNAAAVSATPFAWPLGKMLTGSPQYTFNKVIEYDPQGSARIITTTNTTDIPYCIDIGLQPAHGRVVAATNGANGEIAAVQIDGMSGATRIYRP
jgi:prepilin-type N-terminal cleavage/methylation domain-containing protein